MLRRMKSFLSGDSTDTDDASAPPYLLRVRSSKSFILTTVCLAVFTDIFLYGIIVPVIPFAISSRAGVRQEDVQSWVSILLACYGGALLLLSPLAGWFADVTASRRMPLLMGLVFLGGATVLLCLARSLALLVVGRLLQGLSASIVWTVGTALLVDTVGQKAIGVAIGYMNIALSVALLLAPLLGGIVYRAAGYNAVFYMSFGLIVVDIFLRLVLIEKKTARKWLGDAAHESNLLPGQHQGSSPASPIRPVSVPSPASNEGEIQAYSPPAAMMSSSQSPPPSKLPAVLTLLRSRRLVTALWGCMVTASLMAAFDSVVPLFVRDTFRWNSVGAGLVFLAITIPAFISPFVGRASDHYGPRWLAVFGLLSQVPTWVLLRLVVNNTSKQKVLFCALLTLIGLSLAITFTPLMSEITYVVEAKENQSPGRYGKNGAYAQAYGLFITAFAAGCMIGPIWAGYVRDVAGWKTMTWTLALFAASGALPCVIWTGGYIMKQNAKSAIERASGVFAAAPVIVAVPKIASDPETGRDLISEKV